MAFRSSQNNQGLRFRGPAIFARTKMATKGGIRGRGSLHVLMDEFSNDKISTSVPGP